MINGTESIPNATTPSGKRLPGPWVNNTQKNWPTSGATPHRHECLGSKKPSAADTTQTIGMPTEKYKEESQASLFPDAADTSAHTDTPHTIATRYSQVSFFIHSPVRSTWSVPARVKQLSPIS